MDSWGDNDTYCNLTIYGKNLTKILPSFQLLLQKTQSEIKIIISNENMLKELIDSEIIDILISLKKMKNLNIRILTPFQAGKKDEFHRIAPFIKYNTIETFENEFSVFILDNFYCCFFYLNPFNRDLEISTYDSKEKIQITIFESVFDRLWSQVDNFHKMVTEKEHSELFVDLISHDIGNHHQILDSSLDMIEMLVNDMSKKEFSISELKEYVNKLIKYLNVTKKGHIRTKDLVKNIRRLEKMYREKEVNFRQVDVIVSIKHAFSLVQQGSILINKSIDLDLQNQTTRTSIKIAADELIDDIFINLFTNSLKYTEGTHVRIEVVISDYKIRQNHYYMVTIADHGKGVENVRKKEIFQRFYKSSKGSGLGLSLVRGLVERYNGKIWIGDRILNDYAQGAKFGMLFPAYN